VDNKVKRETMKEYEKQFLGQIILKYNLRNAFEFGTSVGNTTEYLSNMCAKIYTIDIKPDSGIECKNKNITRLIGDSATYDFSGLYGKFDMVIIDGSHKPKYVKRDSRNALKMLRGNGFIFWHDFDLVHPGLVRVVRRFCRSHGFGLKSELGTKLVFIRRKGK